MLSFQYICAFFLGFVNPLINSTEIPFSYQSEDRYEELVSMAYEAQYSSNRQLLDSISGLMIALGEELNNSNYYHNGLAFKSEATARVRPDEAILLAKEALVHFEQTENHERSARLSNTLGHAYSNIGEPQLAIEHYEQALSYSNQSDQHDTFKEIRFRAGVLYNMGFTSIRKGDVDQGAEYMYQCLETNRSINDSTILSSAHIQLGNIKMIRGQLDPALSDYQKALSYRNKQCTSCYRIALSSIAGVFQELGELDSALYYTNIMLPLTRESGDVFSLCVALFNLAELYIKLDEPQLSIDHSKELISLAGSGGFKNLEVNGYNVLANAYYADKQLDLARESIDVVITELDSLDDDNIGASAYQLASRIYEEQLIFDKALEFQRIHQSYADTILNKQSEAQIDELIVQYESKEKEAQILTLEQEKRLNESLFKQRLTIGVGIVLLLGLLGSIYIQYINKRRLLLEKQRDSMEQRLLRSQMNPHFIFNAISSIQTFLFEKSEVETALNYLSKFATLMRQILENSREEFISLSDEIDSLTNYLDLQKLRYSNSFDYNIITDSIDYPSQLFIPPLIAQPFVENAIEHGMIYLQDEGIVNIEFSCTSDKLVLRIVDNGKEQDSLQINTAAQQIKKKSLATIITKERLKLLSVSNQNNYNLNAVKLTTGGTAVTIELPKIYAS